MDIKLIPSPDAQETAAIHPRDSWMDDARGFGVILVVLGHVLGGLVLAGIFPRDSLAAWMDYTLYTFHMPLFFFLAGLNVQRSLRRGPAAFLGGKLWTIAYPYVLWSLVQGGIIMLFARDANTPIHPGDLAGIWHSPIGQFWFLYALMICHVTAALVPNRTAIIVVAAVGFITFAIMPVRPTLALTLHHFPFYVAGLYASGAMRSWRPRALTLPAVALVFAAAVCLGGLWTGMDANGVASLPASILGIVAVLIGCKLLGGSQRWLAVVGQMSMTIYILHILAGSGMRIVMLKLHVPPDPWLYLFVGTAAGVVLPMLAHAFLQRLDLLTAFGLAPLKRRPAAYVSDNTARG